RPSTRGGTPSGPPATSSIPAGSSPTSTRRASSESDEWSVDPRYRWSIDHPLEKGLALAAVGGDYVDDFVALDEVEGAEALAQLAGLGVAEVGTVADRKARRRAAEQRGLHLAGALLCVQSQPRRQPRGGQPRRVAAAGGEVAAAERGGDAG